MSWRHFSTDTEMAIQRYWQDEADGGFTVITEQDVEDVIGHAKVLQGQHSQRSGWAGDLHQVASIPLTIFLQLDRQGVTKDQKALKRWLNASDNSAFRTRPGKI